MKILKTGIVYFALVFGAGWVFGPIRVLWAVPRFGVRTAELLEAPLMLAVMILAARWIVRRYSVPHEAFSRLGMGLVALALVLAAEFAVVLRLRGLTFEEFLATRDPVSGTVYYAMLLVYAILPLLVARK